MNVACVTALTEVNILIVDDEPGSRLMVSSAVRRLGHEAVEAEDGDDGWQRFQAGRPEVLITDWSMCCTAVARAAGCGCSWPTMTRCRG